MKNQFLQTWTVCLSTLSGCETCGRLQPGVGLEDRVLNERNGRRLVLVLALAASGPLFRFDVGLGGPFLDFEDVGVRREAAPVTLSAPCPLCFCSSVSCVFIDPALSPSASRQRLFTSHPRGLHSTWTNVTLTDSDPSSDRHGLACCGAQKRAEETQPREPGDPSARQALHTSSIT
jgi:hypothetical protein